MDNRAIGFFDSGLGGLTCIPHLLREFPHERVVYFGDTARTPYGSKDPSTIRKFAAEMADFLIEEKNVKMVVIACNTVSAVALEYLRDRHPATPFLGIVSPASHAAAKTCTPENRIGVIGTKATIQSGAYNKKVTGLAPSLKVYSMACPALVPLIEEGIVDSDIMDMTIEHYMKPFVSANEIDTLVLGCTHYPFIRRNIERLYPQLRIIDPSEEILLSVADALDRHGLQAGEGGTDHVFYASDLSENFVNIINIIFSEAQHPIKFDVLDLESHPVRKERKERTL
ncbi:MAG: glutamate racemase [Clostridiales bacterium]|nr:glutamate racemase [Clostridiales bacterium]